MEVVGATLGSSESAATLSRDKLDLLYRVMDTNHDGKIDVAELVKFQHALVASHDSQGDMESVFDAQGAHGGRGL